MAYIWAATWTPAEAECGAHRGRLRGRQNLPVLDADVQVRLGRLDLRVGLTAQAGEVVAVLGPNGAGKTTLLRALAGLVAVDSGRIVLDGVTLDDPVTETFVPPELRSIGVVFQDYLLFETMSVLENVAFGLRARGAGRTEARRQATQWLERVGLSDRAADRPGVLSGGQAQRVALARALATSPRLLLLDEPLAALDAGARGEVRRDLRRHLASFEGARVLVTHDPVDALTLADRVVIVEQGRVVQAGTLAEVSSRPRSRYVADLVGVNLWRGAGADGGIELVSGGRLVAADHVQGDLFAMVAPAAVALHREAPHGSPRNVWAGTIDAVDLAGDRVRVTVAGTPRIVAEVTQAAVAELGLRPGDPVWVSVKATEVTAYPV